MKNNKVFIPLIIWFLVFATDVVCAYVLGHPIFTYAASVGEGIGYWGLGYVIFYIWGVPLPAGVVWSPSPDIFPWPYLIINIIIIATILFKKRRK